MKNLRPDLVRKIVIVHVHGSTTLEHKHAFYKMGLTPVKIDSPADMEDFFGIDPIGIVLCGGGCFYERQELPPEIFIANVPILGTGSCMADLGRRLGVEILKDDYVGTAENEVRVDTGDPLFLELDATQTVYMYAHMDYRIGGLPSGVHAIANSARFGIAGFSDLRHLIWGVCFHPGSSLTQNGEKMILNFTHFCVRRALKRRL